jgi:hypothetical protein
MPLLKRRQRPLSTLRLRILMTIGFHNGLEITLSDDSRTRHIHCVGQTGSGKSTLLLNMIAHDLAAGHGLAVIDPHGELAEAALSLVPRSRFAQVRYLNPVDAKPVPFNPLHGIPLEDRPRAADAILSAFRAVGVAPGDRVFGQRTSIHGWPEHIKTSPFNVAVPVVDSVEKLPGDCASALPATSTQPSTAAAVSARSIHLTGNIAVTIAARQRPGRSSRQRC